SETLHRQRLGRQHLVRYERPTTLKPRSLSLFVRLMDRAFKGSLEVASFVYIRSDRRSVSPSLAKPEHAPSPELDGRVGSDALPVAAGYVDGKRPRTLSHAVRHVGVVKSLTYRTKRLRAQPNSGRDSPLIRGNACNKRSSMPASLRKAAWTCVGVSLAEPPTSRLLGSMVIACCPSSVAPMTRFPSIFGPINNVLVIGQWSLPEPSLVPL